MTPEASALFLTAGPAGHVDRLRSSLDRVDSWGALLELAWRFGAQPVFEARVLESAADLIPAGATDTLRQSRRVHELRLAYLHQRLADVVARLGREGVDVMLLKGAANAYTVYDAHADRPMSDVDLLVPADVAQRAYEALLEDGWSPKYPAEYRDLYRDMHHLPPLLDSRASLEVGLEIHTDIVSPTRSPFHLDVADLWANAEPMRQLGERCCIPGPLHRMLHCAIHFAWSHMMREGAWKTFRDVTALVEKEDLDWDALVTAAAQVRSSSSVYWTLRLARDYSGAPVPEEPLRALRPGGAGMSLTRAIASEMVPGQRVCPSTWLWRRLWERAIRPEASGHGAARPWSGQTPWGLPGDHDDSGDIPQANPAAWLRFLTSLGRD